MYHPDDLVKGKIYITFDDYFSGSNIEITYKIKEYTQLSKKLSKKIKNHNYEEYFNPFNTGPSKSDPTYELHKNGIMTKGYNVLFLILMKIIYKIMKLI